MKWCKEEEWAAEKVKEEPKAAEGLEENEMVEQGRVSSRCASLLRWGLAVSLRLFPI